MIRPPWGTHPHRVVLAGRLLLPARSALRRTASTRLLRAWHALKTRSHVSAVRGAASPDNPGANVKMIPLTKEVGP